MSNRLIIIGATAYGLQVLHIASLQGKYDVVGFIDDTKNVGDEVRKIKVLGGIKDIERLWSENCFDYAFIGIGYKHPLFKEQLHEQLLELKIPLATIIHPSAYVDKDAKISQGCIIYENATICMDVFLEEDVHIDVATTICHESHIGRHTYIAPSCCITGKVYIGKCCFIGVNTTFVEETKVTDYVFLGAASLVLKDIEESAKYVGNNLRNIGKYINNLNSATL